MYTKEETFLVASMSIYGIDVKFLKITLINLKKLIFLSCFGLCFLIKSPMALSASCWEVASTPQALGQVTLAPASCTTIPTGTGWTKVDISYGGNPPSDLYLQISLNDNHVTGWKFEPLLVFSHYDQNGDPVVNIDIIPCNGCQNYISLNPFPPEQGMPEEGNRVRLRHARTGKCIYGSPQNGGTVKNWGCWDDPNMTYILKDVGGGEFRLEHEEYHECLYAQNWNGATVHNWGCWNDPNMRFRLETAGGGYRLHHVNTNQCLYGNANNGGQIHSWGCWDDPNMIYYIDIIN